MTITAVAEGIDLLGKDASDLQEDLAIGEDEITGTSKYVTGYTGFSGDPAEQEGNYIALLATPKDETTVITCEVIGGDHGPVTLDEDHMVILRIKNNTQKVKFTSTLNGETKEYEYALTNLTLSASESDLEE